jgi:hypothetical protein
MLPSIIVALAPGVEREEGLPLLAAACERPPSLRGQIHFVFMPLWVAVVSSCPLF